MKKFIVTFYEAGGCDIVDYEIYAANFSNALDLAFGKFGASKHRYSEVSRVGIEHCPLFV